MKKTYLGIGIGIGLILGIGIKLIAPFESTACECAYHSDFDEAKGQEFTYDASSGKYYDARDEAHLTEKIPTIEEKEEAERIKKLENECKQKYHGKKNWLDKALKECAKDSGY